MVSTDSTTEASESSSSEEESEKMVHSRSPAPSQARSQIPQIPSPSSSDSESDDDSDALTPPPKTHQQQEQKKERQPQKQEEPPPPWPSPSALLSNKTAATKTSAKRPRVHSRSPSPSQARTQIPQIPPPSSSDDDSEALTPPPKTHQQQEQKKEQQPQKQKKEQLPLPSPSPSALLSNKTAVAKTSAKRSRVEEKDGIPEPPSTKRKMKGHTVQHSDEVPAKKKKKAQKQNVAEAVSPPSSPQKSAKKPLQVWNSKDELAFLNGLLYFSKGGNEFPKNMSPVYDYVRNMMDTQYSNKQFGDKLRRLKVKFLSLVKNTRARNHSFKSTDEAAVFKLCQQLWGVQDEGDNGHCHIVETVGNASMNGKVKKKKKKQPLEAVEDGEKTKDGEDRGEEGEDGEKTKDGEDQGEEEEERQDEPKRNKTMANGVKCDGGDAEQISRELHSKLCKERDDMVNEMKNTVVKILEESQTKTMAMVRDYLLKESQPKRRVMVQDYLLNARADHVQLPYSDMMSGIHSGRWAPMSSRAKDKALEEKWRKQEIAETEAFSGRLDLMQEECKMCLEGLRASVSSGRS